MLDQRRAKQKGYITLKEAAELADYTPDYVGQLIRAGKIKGEQVYSSVAWVTTEDEVQAYLTDKARVVDNSHAGIDQQSNTSYLMYGAIAAFAVVVLLFQYVLYVSLDQALLEANKGTADTVTMHVAN